MAASVKGSPSKGRGSSIPLEQEWIKTLEGHWLTVKRGEHPKAHGRRHNLVQFGVLLAQESGRGEPFSESSLSRFFRGLQPSDEISDALSAFFDLPGPLLAARHIEEIEWFQLGRSIRDADRQKFRELMVKIRNFVTTANDLDETLNVDGQIPTLADPSED